MRKAFDAISHGTLIRKMKIYGIRGIVANWFESYLSNRRQCVKIDNSKSALRDISTGVPQGSILGPILFLIQMNDLPNFSNSVECNMFADDTTITLQENNYENLISKANASLQLFYNWTLNNRLSLNANKTSALLCTNRHLGNVHTSNLTICSATVHFVDNLKYLGVLLDNKLNFVEHIKFVSVKLSRTVEIFLSCLFSVT